MLLESCRGNLLYLYPDTPESRLATEATIELFVEPVAAPVCDISSCTSVLSLTLTCSLLSSRAWCLLCTEEKSGKVSAGSVKRDVNESHMSSNARTLMTASVLQSGQDQTPWVIRTSSTHFGLKFSHFGQLQISFLKVFTESHEVWIIISRIYYRLSG